MKVEYGYRFSRDFIDVREKEENIKRSENLGRSLMNRWNNEVGRRVIQLLIIIFIIYQTIIDSKKAYKTEMQVSRSQAMTLHNLILHIPKIILFYV